MISYSGITNYGKSSLPSVESWGTNNNILRDPPRSITTRRIDKVSETSIIEQEQQDSSNRIAESILQFPRGVNPMVSVNYGSNGGGYKSGGSTVPVFNSTGVQIGTNFMSGNVQAKLPYRIMEGGAFRPPIQRPQDLLPLSRLPRNNTYVDPIAYKPDFTKKILCQGSAKDYRNVKNGTLQVSSNPTKCQPDYSKQLHVKGSAKDYRNVKNETLQVSSNPTKYQPDYSKQLLVQGNAKDYRSVKNNILDIKIPTIKIQNIERPIPINVNRNIVHTKLNTSVPSIKTQNIQKPQLLSTKGKINEMTLKKSTEVGKVRNVQRPVQISVIHNTKENVLKPSAQSVKLKNIQKPVIVSVNHTTKDIINTSALSNKIFNTNGNYSTKYTDYTVKNPMHISADAGHTQNIYKKVVDSKVSNNLRLSSQRPNNIPVSSNIKERVTKNISHNFNTKKIKNNINIEIPSIISLKSIENPNNSKVFNKKIHPTLERGKIDPLPTIPLLDRNTNNGEIRTKDRHIAQKIREMQNFSQ